ncbi:MAG: carboxypeptidase regulatory-like domain-containing protein [Pedobacter sp.]|nr:MAG: carboxypeptidase regulatory-like domain-containing protein [Pedobacter sp.]
MKKLFNLMLIALLGFQFQGFAQNDLGRIQGTVVDGNAATVESATITLLRAVDSAVVKMSVADKSGKYHFEGVLMGNYFVSISAVGHA